VQETEAPAAEILEKIAECYQVTVEKMIEELNPEQGANGEGKDLHDIEVMANEPTVVNLVNLIISNGLRERARISIVPFEQTLQLRYRVDGLLQESPPPPKQLHAALVSRIKIMADMNIAERFIRKTAISRSTIGRPCGHSRRHHATIYGESLVMRLLEKNTKVLTTQELGLDPERSALLARLVEKPHGLFLRRVPPAAARPRRFTRSFRALHAGIEDADHRRPGRIRVARRGTNSRASQSKFHLRQWPALDSPSGSRRRDGR